MKTPKTTLNQGMKQGLVKLLGLNERSTIQSTTDNQRGPISIFASLVSDARTFIVIAMAASLLLIGGSQFGTAFAQPVSDPLTIFTNSEFENWNSMAEENSFVGGSPKVVFAGRQAYISEENEWLPGLAKVVFAGRQAYISEENEWLPGLAKVVFAGRQAYISEENDFGV